MTRDEAGKITKKVLGYAEAPEVEVRVSEVRRGFLRFARNEATTAGETTSMRLAVTAWKGKRRASVSAEVELRSGRFDEAGARKVVADAEALAAISPEDREYMPLLGPQEYAEVDAFDEETAAAGPKHRAERIRDAVEYARDKKTQAAGFLDQRVASTALANSNELFVYHPSTSVEFSMTARTSDETGSGYARMQSQAFRSLDLREAAAIAVKKATASRNAAERKPDEYPAILEPLAASDLLGTFNFDARRAEEGRSVFTASGGKTRLGEQVFDKRLGIRSDPADALVPSVPYAAGGYPVTAATFVEEGVLKTLSSSRFWAKKQEREPGPFASNLILEGGKKSLNEIIQTTKRGVLVSRFWYIRTVDSQQALVTGLTRDGTFWVEDGEIVGPVKNFRFNDSMVRVLGDLDELGQSVRVGSRMVPALRANAFRFTSLSDAV